MFKNQFIIALTKHRFLGNVFLPYFIQEEDTFYSIERQVKRHDLKDPEFHFQAYEKEMVEMIEKYSDERLRKRFSRAPNVTEFYKNLEQDYFERHISPFIEECMAEVARILMLSPVRLLYRRVNYNNLYDEDEIKVMPFFGRPLFLFERTPEETRYRLKIYLDGKEIPLEREHLEVVANHPCLLLYKSQLVVFEKLDGKKLLPFLSKEYVSIPASMEERYYEGFVRKTIRDFDVRANGFEIRDEEPEKTASLTIEHNLHMEPCLVLRFHYDQETFLPNASRKTSVRYFKEGGKIVFRKIERNNVWEKQMFQNAKQAGLKAKEGYFTLSALRLLEGKEALHFFIGWLNENKPELEKRGFQVKQGKLEKEYFTGKPQLEIRPTIKDDWFDVYATVTFGGFSFPFIKLKNYILNGQREFELPDGQIAIIPEEWFTRYRSLLTFAGKRGDRLHFGKHHYPLVQKLLQPGDDSIVERFRQLARTPRNVSLPEELRAELRSYQKEGFHWMIGLQRNGFGGCLADDMGLGKTLQTLARNPAPGGGQLQLFGEASPEERNQPASLIVLPTSLVYNWEAEIRKFAPVLRVYKHVGGQRKRAEDLQKAVESFDVILTTYGVVRNDIEMFQRMAFFYVILDESQYVKNPSSKTYKAVIKLKSDYRLVLTGTPIENSLSDLWAQMNFLNPGMLGNLAFFQRYFITPVQKHNSEDQMEKLQVLIRPFILRRTKEEVAPDLPLLMEQVVMCSMEESQAQKYEAEKSIIRNSILEGIDSEGVPKMEMIVLQGLTRLRQLANHPLLLNDVSRGESGKLDEIIRMLENVVAEKHKVLVFSSFVTHLELVKVHIELNQWKYSLLTGQTQNREKVINEFQDDPENRIFLISLKAGGVGLNLTSADYVFILDPWWNPAAENQAISRAHRIGQDKHVFVYRFISEDSIEEKIMQLQNRKSSLADKFIHSNNPLQEITKEEIINLFE